MFTIENAGQAITHTNYWDTPHARAGYLYLSINAGAARLLVPDSQRAMLPEMRTAAEVIISRGPWPEQGGREALELLFEDRSDTPFCLHLVAEQCDRLMPDTDQGGGLVVTVWTRAGEQLRELLRTTHQAGYLAGYAAGREAGTAAHGRPKKPGPADE